MRRSGAGCVPCPSCRPGTTSGTWPSWPTSTTERRRSSTPCSGSRAPSVRTRTSTSASWTRPTSSARRASRSSPRTRRCATADLKINIIDTPGHADFGGEVERGLHMVDGVLLLVDASEGPLPQTRFVLRKALSARLPVILVVNKVDRPDARAAEVVDEVYELFLDLDADESADRVPDRLLRRQAGAGLADARRARRATWSRSSTCCAPTSRRPSYTEGAPLQALVTNLAASSYVGRLAICRVHEGTISLRRRPWPGAAPTARSCPPRSASSTSPRRSTGCRPKSPGPGEIVAVAGLPEVTIGETLGDPTTRGPLPVIAVDEPSLSLTIGINTSPLAGTRRQARHRPPGLGPARAGARRQRVAAGAAHRAARRLGGAGAGGAAAGRAGRDDAPRGLRADRRQAAGPDPRDRRRRSASRSSGPPSTCPRTSWASSPSCSPCGRAAWSRSSTTAPAGPAWST